MFFSFSQDFCKEEMAVEDDGGSRRFISYPEKIAYSSFTRIPCDPSGVLCPEYPYAGGLLKQCPGTSWDNKTVDTIIIENIEGFDNLTGLTAPFQTVDGRGIHNEEKLGKIGQRVVTGWKRSDSYKSQLPGFFGSLGSDGLLADNGLEKAVDDAASSVFGPLGDFLDFSGILCLLLVGTIVKVLFSKRRGGAGRGRGRARRRRRRRRRHRHHSVSGSDTESERSSDGGSGSSSGED